MAAALINGVSDPNGQTVRREQNDNIYDGAFTSNRDNGTIYVDPNVEHSIDDDEDIDGYDDTNDEEDYDEEYSERPTLLYLLYSAAITLGIALAVLGIYMLVRFFNGGNGLFIAVAIVSLIFSPFLIRFGILNIRALLNGEYYEDDDDDGYEDDDYDDEE